MGSAQNFFPLDQLYDEDSRSPFLVIVPENDFVPQLTISKSEEKRIGLKFQKYDPSTLDRVTTINEAEDYYLDRATIFPGHHRERPDVTVFALNAQSSVQASTNRLGNAWIALMHPEMFDRISLYPDDTVSSGPISDSVAGKPCWPEIFPFDNARKIGRWTLAAREPYRSINVWVSDHLPRNTMTTLWRARSEYVRKADGCVVMETQDGFVLSPPNPGFGGYVKTAVLDQYEA